MNINPTSTIDRLKIGHIYKMINPLVVFKFPWVDQLGNEENDIEEFTMERDDIFTVLDECKTPNTKIMNYQILSNTHIGWVTIEIDRKDRNYNLHFEEII